MKATLRNALGATTCAVRFGSAVVLLGLIAFSASAHAETRKVSLEDLLKRDTISIRDVEALPYKVRSAAGPVLLASVDNSTEIRFWFEPSVLAALGFGRIVLIARGAPNDESHGTVIWPKASVGHDYGEELLSIYGHQR